jgi:hypothetical protein
VSSTEHGGLNQSHKRLSLSHAGGHELLETGMWSCWLVQDLLQGMLPATAGVAPCDSADSVSAGWWHQLGGGFSESLLQLEMSVTR